jgi:hypothetical protein
MGRSRRRSRSRSRGRGRSRSRSQDRRRSRSRSRSLSRRGADGRRNGSPERRPEVADDKKAARLAKLQAWKAQQQQADALAPPPPPPDAGLGDAVRRAQEAAAAAAAKTAAAPPPPPPPDASDDDGGVDPLDAFMAAEVLPEVTAKAAAEHAAAAEERARLGELMARGRLPKSLEDLIRDEEEERPDMTLEVPAAKVKLVIGAGGERIRQIERRTRCRVQVAKSDAALAAGFGGGVAAAAAAAAAEKTVTLQLFGDAGACEAAAAAIAEAVENREQKAKQRAREYEKKRDARARERSIYHLRHACDYEALGLPLGASKADCRAAYRRLALRWHPDKNPGAREEAAARFQEVSRAYEALMSTDEDARVEQLAA